MKIDVHRILYKCLLIILGFLMVSSAFARPLGGNFELKDTTGHTVSLSLFYGKVVVLAFGFTHCPDICPTTLLQFTQLLSALGSDSDRIQAIFISVDPARDTPEILTQYVDAFNRKILPLTGTKDELKKVAKQYGTYFSYVRNVGHPGYTVDHSGNTYVIDARGKLSAIYPFGTPLDEIERYVKTLLQNSR